jgi:hypothetical protein
LRGEGTDACGRADEQGYQDFFHIIPSLAGSTRPAPFAFDYNAGLRQARENGSKWIESADAFNDPTQR